MTHDASVISAARDLSARINPEQVLNAGSAYEESLRIWNGAVNHRPALVVRCSTTDEVQAAVLTARRYSLPLSVRGGGHDWAGRALRPAGLVIDLTKMRHVSVDPEPQVAMVGGGATSRDVMQAAARYGLAAVSGTVGKVGITGLTLGGGYGPLMGRFGLATDNLLGAEVALADGRLVTADPTRESELYWALRGGGGNFGSCSLTRIDVTTPNKLVTGYIMYPWSEAADVLNRFNTWIADAPDELTVQMGIASADDGGPALMALPAWSGDLEHAQDVIDNLQLLGNPFVSQVGPKTYTEMLSLWERYVVDGRQYAIRTRSVAAYTPDVISALVAAGSTRTSTLSNVYVHHFHGAAARVPINSTAFGIRSPP